MKANSEIRNKAKNSNIKHWQIAAKLGVSEQTVMRWLRVPLPKEREDKILAAIEALEKGEC